MELVECKNLCKTFDEKQILENINLTIPRGKIIGLLGKNGTGKTTLIKLLNDLLTPTSGEVLINGKKPGVESKKVISYLPERTYLDKSMKVSQVITFFEEFYDNFNKEKAIKLLKDLNLELNQRISQMSKGMQEKLQLILVMSRDAELYILDEPLGGVDPATRDYILDTILTNFNEGASVIISTHLIADIERILDEVIFIDKGKIYLASPADELRSKENASIDEIFRRCFIIKQELPINRQIREKEVQLIDENGEKVGVLSIEKALEMAEDKNLDLVLVAPNAKPVVCKIMNYGKYKFEQAKKEKESRKNQKAVEIKEIRVSSNIGQHDFDFKSKNARNFLESGNKVKFTLRFRGRELNNSKAGEAILNKFAESLEDIANVEKRPFLEGKTMFIILAKKV